MDWLGSVKGKFFRLEMSRHPYSDIVFYADDKGVHQVVFDDHDHHEYHLHGPLNGDIVSLFNGFAVLTSDDVQEVVHSPNHRVRDARFSARALVY